MLTAPRRPPGLLGIWLRLAWQRSAQGERTEPDTHQLLSTVGFMLHTAQLQRNAHLDRACVCALRRLLCLLSSHLHTRTCTPLPRHRAAIMAVAWLCRASCLCNDT